MQIVVNFSGGRTSARFCHHMKEKYGDKVVFVYMDTGAEHPKTYDFIRKVNKEFDLNLVCIRADINDTLGVGNDYEMLNIEDLKFDLEVWEKLVAKYGTPYSPGGAFCTDRMKASPYKKYCADVYGVGNYETWIGIRADEPKRLFGKGYNALLNKCGYTVEERIELYRDLEDVELDEIQDELEFFLLDSVKESEKRHMYHVRKAASKIAKAKKANYRYMAEELDDDELDVLDFWKEQPFDLEIEKHKGNCVFCIKKTVGKVALAARDEPELAAQFINVITSDNVRQTDRAFDSDVMYDGNNSLEGIIAMFAEVDTEDMRMRFNGFNPNENAGGCSESCEMFGSED